MPEESKFFPYENIRPVQNEMIHDVYEAINNKKNLIVHAPTGLGKTAAALSPALNIALKNKDTTIFFLTSRHTQHHIAIKTLQQIKNTHGVKFHAVDLVGKQSMCVQEHVGDLYSNEFHEFCKSLKEKNECEYCENTRSKNLKVTVKAKKVIEELKHISPNHSEKIIEICKDEKLCPYEISSILAKDAKVIIADYYYIFHPTISESFFAKTGKKLEDAIIIVDEGHNLPNRIRNLFNSKTSTFAIERAIKEAKKFKFHDLVPKLNEINDLIIRLSYDIKNLESSGDKEILVKKQDFTDGIKEIEKDYDSFVTELEFAADEIREKQKSSFIGGISDFLSKWLGPDKGFARIIGINEYKDKKIITLSYKCLDPSLSSTVIVEHSFSTVLMSGTLNPLSMYHDLLGFPIKNTIKKKFKSPFPKKNRLNLIVPRTTTKFTNRNEANFKEIAKICSDVANLIKGNIAIFFPSYFLMDAVNKHFSELSEKRIIREVPRLSKEGKHDMLEEFKSENKKGAVLLGVAAGSFGEGIDLPGDFLKCVIVVGIPLQKPDLETTELIKYYDDKFGHGWDYGYLYPAMLKSMQNAGRCIRSETDKGAILFLDERYAWTNYKRCFSEENFKITTDYLRLIKDFFRDG